MFVVVVMVVATAVASVAVMGSGWCGGHGSRPLVISQGGVVVLVEVVGVGDLGVERWLQCK